MRDRIEWPLYCGVERRVFYMLYMLVNCEV